MHAWGKTHADLRFEAYNPEGPYIQLLGNKAPKCPTVEGTMGPHSLMVVYVDPLGKSVHSCSKVGLVIAIETGFAEHIGG